MKTLLDIFYKVFNLSALKLYIVIGIIIWLVIYANNNGYFNMKNNKMAQNLALQEMFQNAPKNKEHLDKSEKNWSEKFFNINF